MVTTQGAFFKWVHEQSFCPFEVPYGVNVGCFQVLHKCSPRGCQQLAAITNCLTITACRWGHSPKIDGMTYPEPLTIPDLQQFRIYDTSGARQERTIPRIRGWLYEQQTHQVSFYSDNLKTYVCIFKNSYHTWILDLISPSFLRCYWYLAFALVIGVMCETFIFWGFKCTTCLALSCCTLDSLFYCLSVGRIPFAAYLFVIFLSLVRRVHVCTCMYLYVSVFLCMYVRMYLYVYVCICMYLYASVCICMYLHS